MLLVHFKLCNSIKKRELFWGGDSMCDGGRGLVCPEAREAAAAADGTPPDRS